MNRRLILLLAVLLVLLAVTLGAIFLFHPQSQQVPLPSPSPAATEISVYEPGDTTPSEMDDPLAGLTEEEIAALAMSEENAGTEDFGSGFADVADGATTAPID